MDNPNFSISRRKFIKTADAGALTGPFLLQSCKPDDGILQHACIGVGGMGGVDLDNFLKHRKVQIVALCDVDACLGGEKTESHFAQTGPMTEAILLGTIAILSQIFYWNGIIKT